jgi:hypothetical protein
LSSKNLNIGLQIPNVVEKTALEALGCNCGGSKHSNVSQFLGFSIPWFCQQLYVNFNLFNKGIISLMGPYIDNL